MVDALVRNNKYQQTNSSISNAPIRSNSTIPKRKRAKKEEKMNEFKDGFLEVSSPVWRFSSFLFKIKLRQFLFF